jgi:hypothetical protein
MEGTMSSEAHHVIATGLPPPGTRVLRRVEWRV